MLKREPIALVVLSTALTLSASCAGRGTRPEKPYDERTVRVLEMIPPTVVAGVSGGTVTMESPLHGYVDLHTHPMSHLGFGLKAMHGVPDLDMIIPAGNANCNGAAFRAATIGQALGNCNGTHGGWGLLDNSCGDYIRAGIINNALDSEFLYKTDNVHGDHQHAGSPNFAFWPHQTSILHQQMWWEWIRRAYEGGLRVMVALTVNSETLADIINGTRPYHDQFVADLQIQETIRLVERHDFMEVALSADDVRRIVSSDRLAVVLGMEVDRIGNFGRPFVPVNEVAVRAELRRLHEIGVRYVFPVHLIDNPFGGTAVYDLLFNLSNNHQNGYFFNVVTSSDPNVNLNAGPIGGPFFGVENLAIGGIRLLLEGLGILPAPCWDVNPFRCGWPPAPGMVRCCGSYQTIVDVFQPTVAFDLYRLIPTGHVNALGLTDLGEVAIDEMMRLGMIIDLDHMSQSTMTEVIDIAEGTGAGYPLVFGHNGLRQPPVPDGDAVSERSAPPELIRRVADLGGMFGIGTADATPEAFIEKYRDVWAVMGDRGIGIGSDVNGFEKLPKFRDSCSPGDFATFSAEFYERFFAESGLTERSRTEGRTWDYVIDCGVSHYGLMPEYLFDVRTYHGGGDVYDNLMLSAERFVRMWEDIEAVAREMD